MCENAKVQRGHEPKKVEKHWIRGYGHPLSTAFSKWPPIQTPVFRKRILSTCHESCMGKIKRVGKWINDLARGYNNFWWDAQNTGLDVWQICKKLTLLLEETEAIKFS